LVWRHCCLAQSPGQTSAGMAPAAKLAHVEQVLVHAGDAADAGPTIEIKTSGARVAPNTQVITGPDRIVVDFPGAFPAAALHALKVNQGALTGVRTGLFFSDPPITRVVLDLAEPQSYQISTTGNGIVVKLSPVKSNTAKLDPVRSNPVKANPATLNSVKSNVASNAKLNSATLSLDVGPGVVIERYPIVPGTRTPVAAMTPAARPASATKPADASPAAAASVGVNVAAVNVAPVVSVAAAAPLLSPVGEEPASPKPLVSVTFANGMLSIHSDKATLAQVLYEVQRQTQADIAIPAGAEQEEVAANLGPAAARDVLSSLLNGSGYNFIFIGSEQRLERVILTRRDPNIF
jgi:AMIN domain